MVFFKRRVIKTEREKVAVKHEIALPPVNYFGYGNIASQRIKNLSSCFGQSSVDDNGVVLTLSETSNFYATSEEDTGWVTYSFDVAGFLATLPDDAYLSYVYFYITGGKENDNGAIIGKVVHYQSDNDQVDVSVSGGFPGVFTTNDSQMIYLGGFGLHLLPSKSTLSEYGIRVEVGWDGGHIDGATMRIIYYTYE